MNEKNIWETYTSQRGAEAAPCPDPLELAAYIDGHLDPEERDAIEAHLSRCDLCLESVLDLQAYPPGETADPIPMEAIAAAQDLVTASPQPVNRPWHGMQGVAAALLFVAVSLTAYQTGKSTYKSSDAALIALLDEEIAPFSDALSNDEPLPIFDRHQGGAL
jgi:hypothetical protein